MDIDEKTADAIHGAAVKVAVNEARRLFNTYGESITLLMLPILITAIVWKKTVGDFDPRNMTEAEGERARELVELVTATVLETLRNVTDAPAEEMGKDSPPAA